MQHKKLTVTKLTSLLRIDVEAQTSADFSARARLLLLPGRLQVGPGRAGLSTDENRAGTTL